MKNKRRFSSGVFMGVVLFLYAPLLTLLLFSFNSSKTMRWEGFSLKWYQELFLNSTALWDSLKNSLIVALGAGVLATTIGTLGAIGLTWYKFKMKKVVQTISFLPLIMPEIIIGVSLLVFFSGIHMKLGLLTILIAHTTFNIPFSLLLVQARLDEFDFSIIEAARDLGAGQLATLFKVILPISLPGILSAFLMAVTLSLEDFVITFFVAGPGSSTLPLHVYSMIRFGVSPVINALSMVVIAATIAVALSTVNLYGSLFRK